MSYDPDARRGRARVTVGGRAERASFALAERWFDDHEVTAALTAAGLTAEKAEPWSPFSFDAPGKTWWISRKKR
jgi:hypothetical protein